MAGFGGLKMDHGSRREGLCCGCCRNVAGVSGSFSTRRGRHGQQRQQVKKKLFAWFATTYLLNVAHAQKSCLLKIQISHLRSQRGENANDGDARAQQPYYARSRRPAFVRDPLVRGFTVA